MVTVHPRGRLAQDASPEGTPHAGHHEPPWQLPWWPWISAHLNGEVPPDVIGRPIATTATQEGGPAFWAFPGPRALDRTIFGRPEDSCGTQLPALFLSVLAENRVTT